MELHNWLKRKYPHHYEWLVNNYEEYRLQYLKVNKYNVGILKEDNGENKKGDLVIYKRHKEIIEENQDGYEYPNEGGWTGDFEYYYHFAKPTNGMWDNRSFIKLVE